MTPPRASNSLRRLLVESLTYHWRMNLALALGVVAGTAVLTGALVVGDSVRGSLRDLALDRLGPIDDVLVTDRMFRTKLANELTASPDFAKYYTAAIPAILLEASLSQPDTKARANHVTVLALDQRLGDLEVPKPDEVTLNQTTADELGVRVGQDVLLRLPAPSEIPRDSALGRKTETVTTRRVKVTAIIPSKGLGSFNLRPNQAATRNAFVNLATMQQALRQTDRVNAILVTANDVTDGHRLQAMLHPTLDDFGLHVEADEHGYFDLTSDRMLLDAEAERSAMKAFGSQGAQPVFTYLANTIADGDREAPYSTIAAIDFATSPPLGPWRTPEGETIEPLKDGEIVLSSWAADDLEAKVGDAIAVTYFLPESTHGAALERTTTFTLRAICALEGLAADPKLTPTLPGVTDQVSIADWNPPFPFDSSRVRKKDEDYWDEHRATPKAFVNLATGRKLFGSRFGDTTSIRVTPRRGEAVDAAEAAKRAAEWRPDPIACGFAVQPVKAQSLAASSGTTPFSLLFLGFSMFIIAAAVMLVMLLFRLNIERRAQEVGILRAVGFSARAVRRLLLTEGVLVAAMASVVGLAVGVGYAWLMVAGLRSWWVAAVTTPFLRLHATWPSFAIGYGCGLIAAIVAIVWGLRQMRHVALRRLLAGETGESTALMRSRPRVSRIVAIVAVLLAIGVSVAGTNLSGEAQAGSFFGAGALVLTAALAWLWSRLRGASIGAIVSSGGGALARLAMRNAARNPSRSTLTVGLVASASFIILAIGAFHLQPPASDTNKNTGTGGFTLVAESDQPIFQDLNSDDGRFDLAFSKKDDDTIAHADAKFYPLRVQAGDDASCLNLYQTQQPRVLGVPEAMIDRDGFAWAATLDEEKNPWKLLDGPSDDGVPVVLDFATAMYSLHLSGKPGDVYEIEDGRGRPLKLRVVGLLQNSVFQGSLLISERAFLEHFPDVSGFRFFLIDAKPSDAMAVRTTLDRVLGDYGFDTQRASDRLAGYLAVQNTYLETFQSLGGLGLLLGTFGLATVTMRNALERRGELALLRAVGFRRATLGMLVLLENMVLLVGGLAIEALAAVVALAPHLHGASEAGIPWASAAGTIVTVIVVGMLVGLIAVRWAMRAPIMEALKAE